MEDPNIFAVLTACDGRNKACTAIRRRENDRWFQPARQQPARKSWRRGSSRSSAAYCYGSDSDSDEGVDRLVFRFDEVFRSAHGGLQFGTDPTLSDVVIGDPGAAGISRTQYIITVDLQLRIWLHDRGSTHGTSVSHVWNTKARNENVFKAADTWIMAFAPAAEARFEEVRIRSGSTQFRIKFPNHNPRAQRPYLENLRGFANRCVHRSLRPILPGFQAMGFQSVPRTQNPTVHNSPRQSLVYIRLGKLGTGGFGTVHQAIRARDGETVAIKTFDPPSPLSKEDKEKVNAEWISEINHEFSLARDHRHPNILEILDFVEKPKPLIVMHHYPAGSLKHCQDSGLLTCELAVTAFGQTLNGLRFLHHSKIVHRDLKPENILVTMEPLFKVVIADFGLAKMIKNETLIRSSPGTLRYMAPEVHSDNGYRQEVDIWSLGIVGLETIYQLPKSPKDKSAIGQPFLSWPGRSKMFEAAAVDENQKNQQSGAPITIIANMLKWEGKDRWPAKKCLAEGLDRRVFVWRLDNCIEASPGLRTSTFRS